MKFSSSQQTRREFLQFLGYSGLSLSALSGMGSLLSACSSTPSKAPLLPGAKQGLLPIASDKLELAEGLNYYRMLTMGDEIGKGLRFGCNNDYLHFHALPGKTLEGLLWVNHETPIELFVSGWDGSKPKTKAQVELEMDSVGGSIVHIMKVGDTWRIKKDSPYNRRITGKTMIPFAWPEAIEGRKEAMGTLANCAGGYTPWGSFLTCEENYDIFYGETHMHKGKKFRKNLNAHDWFNHFDNPPEHYGWVVEIEPLTGKAKKLVSLGRFSHESATVTLAADGRAVVYTADDARDEHLYKFIAKRPGTLEEGTLYAANTETGEWLALDWQSQEILRKNFKNQTDVLIHARKAAKLLGATPLARPEDIEINPKNGDVLVACTMNIQKGDLYGSLLRIREENPLALRFQADTFLAGGPQAGFANPDNMIFDKKGNLWFTTDMPGSIMNTLHLTPFKNNGLFYVPLEGANAGRAVQVASAPIDAEFTGPFFLPDGETLALCVQHPGERSEPGKFTSHWPEGGNSIPKSAVVAIQGPLLRSLLA